MNDDLISISGVAEILCGGKTKKNLRRAHRLKLRTGFPVAAKTKPYQHWDRDAVIQWGYEEGYLDPLTGTPQKHRMCWHCRQIILQNSTVQR